MYEDYSKQALPSKKHGELLGASLCIFNNNFAINEIKKAGDLKGS